MFQITSESHSYILIISVEDANSHVGPLFILIMIGDVLVGIAFEFSNL